MLWLHSPSPQIKFPVKNSSSGQIKKIQKTRMSPSQKLNGRRQKKRKALQCLSSVFHLEESDRATIAKNDLLFHTCANEKFYSTDKIAINRARRQRELSQTFDSWHGEKVVRVYRESQSKGREKLSINLSSSETLKEKETYRRHLLRSADFTSFKKSPPRKGIDVKHFRKSIIEINSCNLSGIPIVKTTSSSLKQLKTTIASTRRRISRNASIHFPQNCQKIEGRNKKSSELSHLTYLNFQDSVPIQKSKEGNVGFVSTFKRKCQKKGNWLKINKPNSNFYRIDQFKTSNSPLKKQIDKIIGLLQEESTFLQYQ